MATDSLVMELKDSGQAMLEALRNGGFDVTAAAWLRVSIEERWLLYIASSEVDSHGQTAAYRSLHDAIAGETGSWVFEVDTRLIRTDDPVAQAILELRRQTPTPVPINYGGRQLGGITIDSAYIYAV